VTRRLSMALVALACFVLIGGLAAAEAPPRRWKLTTMEACALRGLDGEQRRLESEKRALDARLAECVAEIKSNQGIPSDAKLRVEGDYLELVEVIAPVKT
jgi:hypothetical protein